MAWSGSPKTWAYNELVTAAMMNAELRDRLVEIWKVTTKGDLLVAQSGTVLDRLPVGTNGQVLIADSSQPLGVRWATLLDIGIIVKWSGSIATIPAGWALCNGSNGTPDLRGKFIIGAGGAYNPAATGGSATKDISHTHTQGNTGNENSHNHPFSGNTGDDNMAGSGELGLGSFSYHPHQHPFSGTTGAGSAHFHTNPTTGSSGSSTQDILPPYYALAYIMRIS